MKAPCRVSRVSFFWNRPSERGNPLAKKRISFEMQRQNWMNSAVREKNNHLIDLEIKNSFLSFRLLNWRFMDCLIYSIVFLFLIIKKLRCSLIKYNNFKIVQRLLCFFFFSISPNVEDDSIIWLTDDWYLTIYIRNTYFSRLTYSCSYEYISLLIIKYSQHFFSASLSYNKWQNSYNV